MTETFNDLPWHDAVIVSVEIDRRRPGEADEVILCLVWPNERRSRLRFSDCYALETKMNFGVVALETVRAAVERDDTDELRVLREKWTKMGVDVSDLRCFTIETNSTASTINVYARAWVRESENSS